MKLKYDFLYKTIKYKYYYHKARSDVVLKLQKYKIMSTFNKKVLKCVSRLIKKKYLRGFKVFGINDVDEIRKWAIQNFEIWKHGLTDEEIQYIRYYSGNTFRQMNRHLRGQSIPFEDDTKDCLKDMSLCIENALSKTSVPEDIIVFRWMTYDGFYKYAGLNENKELNNRIILSDGAFISTSLLCDTIPSHINCHDSNEYVLLIIRVLEGTTGAYTSCLTDNDREFEILLSRKYSLKVSEVIYRKMHNMILLCDLIK